MVHTKISANKLSDQKRAVSNVFPLTRCPGFLTLQTEHVHCEPRGSRFAFIRTVIMNVDMVNSGVTGVYGR